MAKGIEMQLLKDVDVAARLSLSRRKIWDLHARGALPEPRRIGRAVRWDESEIAEWIAMGCPSRERFEAECAAGTGR